MSELRDRGPAHGEPTGARGPADGDTEGSVHQVVFRWDGNHGRQGTGMSAVARSCSADRAEEVGRELGPLLWVSGAAAGRPSVVRAVSRDGDVLLVQRWPTTDRAGRPSTVSHVLVGAPAALRPRRCFGLSYGGWGNRDSAEQASGRLHPIACAELGALARDRGPGMVAALPTVKHALLLVTAEWLRDPAQRVSLLVRDENPPGWPDREATPLVFLGLYQLFGRWLPQNWTFATYDAVDTHPLRLMCVPRWEAETGGAGPLARLMGRPPADPQFEHKAAARLVDHLLAHPEGSPGVPHLVDRLGDGALLDRRQRRARLQQILDADRTTTRPTPPPPRPPGPPATSPPAPPRTPAPPPAPPQAEAKASTQAQAPPPAPPWDPAPDRPQDRGRTTHDTSTPQRAPQQGRDPNRDPSRGSSRNPHREAAEDPSPQEPQRAPYQEPQKGAHHQPQKGPYEDPRESPYRGPQEGHYWEAPEDPYQEPREGPTHEPQKGHYWEAEEAPYREPQEGPYQEPSYSPHGPGAGPDAPDAPAGGGSPDPGAQAALHRELRDHRRDQLMQRSRLMARLGELSDDALLHELRSGELPLDSVELLLDELGDTRRVRVRRPEVRHALCAEVLRNGLYFPPHGQGVAGPSRWDMATRAAHLFTWAVAPLARDERYLLDLRELVHRMARDRHPTAGTWIRQSIIAPANGEVPDLPPTVWQQLLRDMINRNDAPPSDAPPAPREASAAQAPTTLPAHVSVSASASDAPEPLTLTARLSELLYRSGCLVGGIVVVFAMIITIVVLLA